MAERYANCTVHHGMHSDRRFDLLAQLAGWSRPEACWRMVELWSRCTALQTDQPPPDEIRIHLGSRGADLMVEAALAERLPGGGVRVLGGGISGGDTDRFGWYEPVSRRNAAGGKARAELAKATGRGPRGQFTSEHQRHHQPDQQLHQRQVQHPTSQTSATPATSDTPPASGIRIPEDQNSLSCAIQPTPVPVVPQPAQPAVPPGESSWHRRQRWWLAMLESDGRIRAAGIEPSAPSLPKSPAGIHELNMNRCERQLLDGGLNPDEVDQRMRHIVAVAEAEAIAKRRRTWFMPALIWDPERAARAADTSIAQASALPAAKNSTAPQPSRPTRKSENSPLQVSTLTPAERIALAAEARATLGLADGARAPPSSTAITNEQQPDRERNAQ